MVEVPPNEDARHKQTRRHCYPVGEHLHVCIRVSNCSSMCNETSKKRPGKPGQICSNRKTGRHKFRIHTCNADSACVNVWKYREDEDEDKIGEK